MLKKRYKLFLGGFVLLLILGAILSGKILYTYDTPAVENYSLQVEKKQSSSMENVPLVFSFENGVAVLQCAPSVYNGLEQIHFRYGYGDADSMPVEDFSYRDDMNGTILAQSQTKDGSVLVSAKSSVLISQSFDSYAWDSHVFGDATIPVELSYGGSGTMSTDITVLVYGEPYTGALRLQTAAGKNTMMEISDGLLSGLSVQDLRKGLAVTIENEAEGTTLIGSYIVEDYPMFTFGYLKAMSNMFLLVLLVAIGCGAICLIRMLWRKYKLIHCFPSEGIY